MTKIRDQEQLIDAAAKVFAEKGFDAARLEDIAAEVGVLQGSLYYHVGSKAQLLSLVQRRRLLQITEKIEGIATAEADPRTKLETIIREHLRHLEYFLPESAHWFTEPTAPRAMDEGREQVRELNRRYLTSWASVLEEGKLTGVVRTDVDSTVIARALLGMCNWLPRWYSRGGEYSIDELIEMLFKFAWNGVATEG